MTLNRYIQIKKLIMPLFLRKRNTSLREMMDEANCDTILLENTYKNFTIINRLLSGWQHVFEKYIKHHCPDSDQTYTLLDIGFGGGDIPVMMHNLAKKHGIQLDITAIELDDRALDYVQKQSFPTDITFRCVSEKQLIEEGEQFDFVISNHLMHHLTKNELVSLMNNTSKLATKCVIFNDLSRNVVAWILFNLMTLFAFRNSFIRTDGLRSIRRSYTCSELRQFSPRGWKTHSLFPFRLLAVCDKTKTV